MGSHVAQYEALESVEIVYTTEKAIQIAYEDDEFKWIPRSVCEQGDELEVGDTDVRVAKWFIDKNHLPT